jgi:hypothetical protein
MVKSLYPDEWPRLAREIKEACNFECQMCGRICRDPKRKADSDPLTRSEIGKLTLTVAHWDQEYLSPEVFVVALCSTCHNQHDAEYRHRNRQVTLRAKARRHHLPFAFMHEPSRPQASRSDIADLAAYWPAMPDVEGVDLFSQYPVAGEESTT